MKKIFGLAILVFASFIANAQNDTRAEIAHFNTVKYSFGKIKQNIPATYSFELKNVSSKPLIIEQATAGCGCTTPKFEKRPILKGKSSKIEVTYNAANPGPFTKTVSVKFLNVPEPTILTIEGEVITK